MENQIKITEEELGSIYDLRDKITKNVETIGRLNIQRHFAERELKAIQSKIEETLSQSEGLSSEENEIFVQITSKYGEGDLNFETGVYTPRPKVG
jgi:hypothetical protein